LFVSTVNEPDHTHSLSPTRFVQVSSTPIAFPHPLAHLPTSTDFLFACQQLGCPLSPHLVCIHICTLATFSLPPFNWHIQHFECPIFLLSFFSFSAIQIWSRRALESRFIISITQFPIVIVVIAIVFALLASSFLRFAEFVGNYELRYLVFNWKFIAMW